MAVTFQSVKRQFAVLERYARVLRRIEHGGAAAIAGGA